MSTTAKTFSKFSSAVAQATGRPLTFVICLLLIAVWGISGPVFHFSDTWQLVINTGTTIVTFLQVFLIQNTQNRDGTAVQAKLDELIRASAAQNRFIGVETLTEDELEGVRETEEGTRSDRQRSAQEAADEAVDEVRGRAEKAGRQAKPTIT